MFRKMIPLCLVVLLPVGGLLAQSRAEKPNDATIELGGKCFLYSLTYQRMVAEQFGLEVGVSGIGGGTGGDTAAVFFLSGGGRFYFTKKAASPFLSGGIVYVTAGTSAGPGTEWASGAYFYASPGFEFRMSSGFLFRATVNFLIKDGFFVWPGINLGVAF
jgi:hypothetical protein